MHDEAISEKLLYLIVEGKAEIASLTLRATLFRRAQVQNFSEIEVDGDFKYLIYLSQNIYSIP
jgi:hypothetical protein